MNKKHYSALFLSMLLFVGVGCGEKIPSREMSSAKQKISQAEKVRADLYAAEELKAAKDTLCQSHDLVAETKLEEARAEAEDAQSLAEDAYNKAAPILAQESINAAENSLLEADEVYAQELASQEFAQAKIGIEQANSLFEEKSYYKSHLEAIKAEKSAKAAIALALTKKSLLNDVIVQTELILTEAKNYGASEYFIERTKAIDDSLIAAKEALDSKKLKAGFSVIEPAKIEADQLYLDSLKNYTMDNLASTEKIVVDAEKSEGAKVAPEKMATAKETLTEAENFFSEAKYNEALAKSAEARKLAYLTINTKPVKKVEVKEIPEKPEVVKPVEKSYVIYKVKYIPERRDCLWRIADKFYNNPKMWTKIYNANKDKISDPHLIRPGQKIKIPKK